MGAAAHVLHDSILNATRILPPPMFMPSAPSRIQPYANDNPLVVSGSCAANDATGLQARNPTAKIAKARVAKIPRPPNAFILYRQHHHHRLRSETPELKNNDISKIVGAMWAAEKKEVKEYFQRKAVDLKEQHANLYPDYQYAPRKTSEKKRRATQKKRSAAAPADPPNTTPLLPADLVPSFLDGDEPNMLMHEVVPGQAGFTDQMAEKHNAALFPGSWSPGETFSGALTFAFPDMHQDLQVYSANVPMDELLQGFIAAQTQEPVEPIPANNAGSTTLSREDAIFLETSQIERNRHARIVAELRAQGYFIDTSEENYGGNDFTGLDSK